MSWIQTYTGKAFWPLNPRQEDLDIIDIARSLSMQCRFNGHCLTFYSVAEHSVRVADSLPKEFALWGLLHDAGEAYLVDIPRPIKRELPSYQELEDRLLEQIAQRYNLSWPIPEEVHHADTTLLVTEKRDLMKVEPQSWGIDATPLPEKIIPLPQAEAEALFLKRFDEFYTGE